MVQRPERRRVARLLVPARIHNPEPEQRQVRLVDLSLQGARIEHPDALTVGLLHFIDLPPALGRGSLSGRVVWTRLHRQEQTLEGERQHYYRSGLTWSGLTCAQQGALTAVLKRLTAAREPPVPE